MARQSYTVAPVNSPGSAGNGRVPSRTSFFQNSTRPGFGSAGRRLVVVNGQRRSQDNIAASVAASYDMPIAVSVIEKLSKFRSSSSWATTAN